MSTLETIVLHPQPYRHSKNNRKMTIGRIANEITANVQSIPIFEDDHKTGLPVFKGYKYIYHK